MSVPSNWRLFVGLYALSGAAALVYEITWTRLLTLQMGQTVAAISTVLAAFMGGLAAGSWIGSRYDRRRGSVHHTPGVARLRAYAALELLSPPSRSPCRHCWRHASRYWRGRTTRGSRRYALRSSAPCSVSGSWECRRPPWARPFRSPRPGSAASIETSRSGSGDSAGTRAAAIGALYAGNTAGAAAGAIAAGFWLLPAIGLRGTTWVAAVLNLAAAAGALMLARSSPSGSTAAESAATTTPAPQSVPRKAHRQRDQQLARRAAETPPSAGVACAAAAISGTVALVYEVAWTRLLVLVIGPTTYAFTIVVASFVVGIAIGSAAAARLVRRTSQPLVWLGGMLVVTAVAASASGWFAASRLPLMVASQVADPNAAFGRVITLQAAGIAILLLPMTCALGAAFPFALAAASTGQGTVARDTARVYTWNTFGAIAGSIVGGFVLLPSVGLDRTFRLAALTGAATALVVWMVERRRQPQARGRIAVLMTGLAVATASAFLLPPWDLQLLASGAYKYAPYIAVADLERDLRTWRQVYYKDGAAATVSVRELAGMRSLVIDGKADASNMGDMLTQRLLGLLPVLLHRDPQEICVIGLGSGVTAGSALARGTVRRTDVVEISPEVTEASRFFARENGDVLEAPGVRVIVADGRSHLLLTRRRYDVIVSEPSNPWMAGIAALFTREFFEAARARLQPDGLLCQWAHTYDMSQADLQSIVQTFASVFPQATMWLVGQGDLLLIGTNGASIEPHLDGLSTRLRQGTTSTLLADVAIADRAAPFALFSLLVGGPAELQRYGSGAAIQRDDRMALEFSAPRAIYGRPTTGNAATIRQLSEPGARMPAARQAFAAATDASWAVAGAMELRADGYEVAYDRFQRAVRLNPSNVEALSGLTDAATAAHLLDEERLWLQELATADVKNVPVRVELSRLLALTGNMEGAAAAAGEAMRAAPDDPRPGEQLASIFADAGEADRLSSLAAALIARFPSRDKPRYFRANALLLEGRAAEAAAELRPLVSRNPHDVRAQSLLGVACATGGLRDCALAAFAAALAADPRDTATYVNLGVFHLQAGDAAAAAGSFAIALTLDRSSAPAAQGLEEARTALAARR